MSEPWSLRDKVVLITGVTQGIGRVTARELARQGAEVVMIARDRRRGEDVLREIAAQTGNRKLELLVGDLSSQADVRRLAAEFLAGHAKLHVLINNAGAAFLDRQQSVDGIELTFALNHLAYYLLTELLLPTLKASAPARIINVASRAHKRATLDPEDLDNRRAPAGYALYEKSKLCNVVYTNELARRLAGSGVTANSLHPGVVATGFGKNNGGLYGLLMRLGAPFLISPEQGASTSIYLASSPEVEGVSGRYFVKCRESAVNPQAKDAELARRLIEVSERLTTGRSSS